MKLNKNNFHQHKRSASLKDANIEKVIVSNKISLSGKNYIYSCIMIIQPLNIILQKRKAYLKNCDGQNKWMCLIKNDKLKRYNITWYKISANIKK